MRDGRVGWGGGWWLLPEQAAGGRDSAGVTPSLYLLPAALLLSAMGMLVAARRQFGVRRFGLH